jgi:hypothetical protein
LTGHALQGPPRHRQSAGGQIKGAESQAIAAHLRYLQREGVTLDGRRGHAYSASEDEADPKAFTERGLEDRHQFRFIVAAEDGVALGDLKPFTLMARMEQDLDTTLDWVAVDHYHTGHPHTHVVVRYLVRVNRHLLISRLERLVAMQLATPVEPGIWDLSPKLQPNPTPIASTATAQAAQSTKKPSAPT